MIWNMYSGIFRKLHPQKAMKYPKNGYA